YWSRTLTRALVSGVEPVRPCSPSAIVIASRSATSAGLGSDIVKGRSIMTWSKLERVENLAALVGISIADVEAAEVAERLESLVRELEKLEALDLSAVEPVCVFADEDDHDA